MHLVPVGAAAEGTHRITERAVGFTQLRRLAVDSARRGFTMVDHEPLQEMDPQYLVVTVGAAVPFDEGEQPAPLQVGEAVGAVGPFEQDVAALSGEPIEGAGLHEEGAVVRADRVEHVRCQVFPGQSGPAEPGQQLRPFRGRPSLRREMKQLEPGGPTPGAAGQRRDLLRP